MRASELFNLVFDDLGFYATVYFCLIAVYLLLYRKAYWGIFDPMFYSIINLVGGAFCVWLLYYRNSLKSTYGWSFVYTEIALLAGVLIALILPVKKPSGETVLAPPLPDREGLSEFDIFNFFICCTYILIEMVSIATVGIVLLSDEESHTTAYSDHSVLRVFVASYRTLMISVLFYKKIVLKDKWHLLDLLSFFFLLFGVLTSGAKGSILSFVWMYAIIAYPLIYAGKIHKIKLSLPVLLTIGSFPIIVVMLSVGAGAETAAQQVYLRLLASGDIFLLGYYDDVINSITETSFFKYAFYPGWGTILKNLGFPITPPRLIGSDIFEYYTSRLAGGGPNARHNYIAYYFFGLYGGIFYSFIIGVFIGYVRNIYKYMDPYKMTYFGYLFFAILANYASGLIDDINVFTNLVFWSLLFLVVSFVVTKLIHLILKALVFSRNQKLHADEAQISG